jgi:transcriptional regulator with XRE-family HTH domain
MRRLPLLPAVTASPPDRADLLSRISAVLARYPTRRAAAEASGKSTDMLSGYESGRNEPTFGALARLAAGVGVSLDWLASGEGAMMAAERGGGRAAPDGTFDAGLVHDVVIELELFLINTGRRLTPEKKARVVALLCEQFSQSGRVNQKVVQDIAALAS